MVMRRYEKIEFRGRTFDRMTAAGVEHLEYFLGVEVDIMQGPFNTTVSVSSKTHWGSGAIDFAPPPGKTVKQVIRAGRLAGWALYHRPELWRDGARLWGEHYHGIQIGNAEVHEEAAKQVQDYFAGLDALASHAPDKDKFRPNPIVPFRYPLGVVSLHAVQDQARQPLNKRRPIAGVRHMQRALNLKSGTNLKVDGFYGVKTKAAYARWEKQHGGDGDGIPAMPTLKLLGAARFRIPVAHAIGSGSNR